MDAQASPLDSTVHVQRFFLPKMLKQTTVMLFDDVTDVLLIYFEGRYRSKHAQDPGGVQFFLSVYLFASFGFFCG